MSIEWIEALRPVADVGLGIASFVALLYFGVKVMTWANKFMTNHMAHIEDGVTKMAMHMERMVEQHGEMKEGIVEIRDIARTNWKKKKR